MRLTEEAKRELFAMFMQMDNVDGYGFRIERELDAPTGDKGGRLFSEESMDMLMQQIGLFVGTRILLAEEKRNEIPTLLDVQVRVTCA